MYVVCTYICLCIYSYAAKYISSVGCETGLKGLTSNPVLYRVHQAEYVIRFLVAVSQQYVNNYSTCSVGSGAEAAAATGCCTTALLTERLLRAVDDGVRRPSPPDTRPVGVWVAAPLVSPWSERTNTSSAVASRRTAMVSVGATTPRGGTSTQGKNPPQGGAAHGAHGARAHHRGAHNTAGGPQGAPHRGGHQHTGGALPPANM